MKTYLNIGCGKRWHPAWTNLDMVTNSVDVIRHDLTRPLPFPANHFDLVYHSHVLEHFSREDGSRLIAECVRVLRSQGVLRVVVPDLEKLVRSYLRALEHARQGTPGWDANYEWSLLALYDQATRTRPGGQMLEYLRRDRLPNPEYVRDECGSEMESIIRRAEEERKDLQHAGNRPQPRNWFSRKRRREFADRYLGAAYRAFRLGRFRLGGEVHQWMYDGYALENLLRQHGLHMVTLRGPLDSAIPGWPAFNLDSDPDGRVYKPESLFVEGTKH